MTKSSTITVSKSDLAAMIAKAVAAALSNGVKEAKPVANTLVDGKTERQLQLVVQANRAFKKAGFKDAVAHENVKTFNRWMAEGRKVKAGERAIKVKNLRLFHVSQTEFVGIPSKAEQRAEGEAAMASAA
jgi:uncharacterized protein YqgV (UPF0045/DUF77 family)